MADIQENMFIQAEENFNASLCETDDFSTLVDQVNNKKVAMSDKDAFNIMFEK